MWMYLGGSEYNELEYFGSLFEELLGPGSDAHINLVDVTASSYGYFSHTVVQLHRVVAFVHRCARGMQKSFVKVKNQRHLRAASSLSPENGFRMARKLTVLRKEGGENSTRGYATGLQ